MGASLSLPLAKKIIINLLLKKHQIFSPKKMGAGCYFQVSEASREMASQGVGKLESRDLNNRQRVSISVIKVTKFGSRSSSHACLSFHQDDTA
jgi:hypothetical protein